MTAQLKPLRREIRMIFQDPYSSLNPRMTLLEIVGDPLKLNTKMSGKEIEERVAFLLRRVGLRPEYMHRYPHAFSGGERQRIGIARARWRWTRDSWWPTSRCRRSTCRCAPKSSTCCRTFSRSSA